MAPLLMVGVVLVVAGLLLTLSGRLSDGGAAGAAATVPAPVAPRPTVQVIGDSLVHQSRDRLDATLTAEGFDATIASKPSQPLGSEFIQTAITDAGTRPPDVVVLATASNDAVAEARFSEVMGADEARAAYRRLLADAIARFPDRCIVVVNARDAVNALYLPAQVPLLNEDLAAVAAEHANVVVVDWAGTSRPHGEDWFVADSLHFGADPNTTAGVLPGAQAYADAIAAGAGRCAAPAA